MFLYNNLSTKIRELFIVPDASSKLLSTCVVPKGGDDIARREMDGEVR
jgi:hypothetical protein